MKEKTNDKVPDCLGKFAMESRLCFMCDWSIPCIVEEGRQEYYKKKEERERKKLENKS